MSDLPGWLQATRQQTRQRRRPLPRSMRPAWETTPEATQPYALPRRALNDPNTVPYERRPTQQQIQHDRELERFARMHELNRNDVNTPPGTYFGQDTLEMTGAPALSRGMDALAAGDPGRALPEVAMGGASILGWGFGATPAGRAPRLPRTNAPMDMADLGRLASQGFDESDTGFGQRPPTRTGPNEDRYLFGRSPPRLPPEPQVTPQARSGSDAGPVQGAFDPSSIHYKGSDSPVDRALLPSRHSFPLFGGMPDNFHELGEGIYGSPYPGVAARYGDTVHPYLVRGPLISNADYAERLAQIEARPARARARPRAGPDYRWYAQNERILQNELRREGYSGVRGAGEHEYESVVWNEADTQRLPPRPSSDFQREQDFPWELHLPPEQRRASQALEVSRTAPDGEPVRDGPNAGPPRPPPRPRPPRRPTE